MPRVLVVDDELRICRFLQRALEAEGFDAFRGAIPEAEKAVAS